MIAIHSPAYARGLLAMIELN